MASTYTSISRGFSLESHLQSGSDSGPTEDVSSSQQQTITIAVGEDPSPDGGDTLGAFAQGTATAVGTDTLAIGTISATAETGTAYDSAHAEADFLAIGVGGLDDLAFATTDVFAEVTGNFDIVISIASSTSTTATIGDTSIWLEQSSISVTGIDIGGSLPADIDVIPPASGDEAPSMLADADAGSGEIETDQTTDLAAPDDYDIDIDISGNIAVLDFYAFAAGEATYADAIVSVFTLEDQLSSIDAIVIAEIAL